jgi:hypothetical protein
MQIPFFFFYNVFLHINNMNYIIYIYTFIAIIFLLSILFEFNIKIYISSIYQKVFQNKNHLSVP